MSYKTFVEDMIEKQSLGIFTVGCDRKNFEILKEIIKDKKVNMEHIKTKYGLSSMPANRRINMMAEVGLVERINKKRDVISTSLGITFLKLISKIKKVLKTEVNKKLKVSKR